MVGRRALAIAHRQRLNCLELRSNVVATRLRFPGRGEIAGAHRLGEIACRAWPGPLRDLAVLARPHASVDPCVDERIPELRRKLAFCDCRTENAQQLGRALDT